MFRAHTENPSPTIRAKGGYILLEATVALVVLGVGVFAIHGTLRESLLTRGQAQDVTQARFLLQQVISQVEMQPKIPAGKKSGRFEGDLARFEWEYNVRTVNVPPPKAPPENYDRTQSGARARLQYKVDFILHIRATVSWTRGGRPYSESVETLFNPFKLWEPRFDEEL